MRLDPAIVKEIRRAPVRAGKLLGNWFLAILLLIALGFFLRVAHDLGHLASFGQERGYIAEP